jgi:dihydroflavonol-4-reductase
LTPTYFTVGVILYRKANGKRFILVINPGPIYGPTLTGNLATEAMDFFKKLITGQVSMLPRAYSVMSDVRSLRQIKL